MAPSNHISNAMMPRWDTRIEMKLARPDALRVLSSADLGRIAAGEKSEISGATVDRWIGDAIQAGRLVRVVRGLYLNRMIQPPAQLCEASFHLRPGAVVSLQAVLGDAGVWHSYTPIATAIVPLASNRPIPSLGLLRTQAGEFEFRGMPAHVLDAGKENDRLVEGIDYLRATPEAALLHWVYLSKSPRSTLGDPPFEMDNDALDFPRMKRLAKAMSLTEALNDWLGKKKVHDESLSNQEQSNIPSNDGPSGP